MNKQDFKRKLTAVFSADVAGHSRLMGEDGAATVKTLEVYKQLMFSIPSFLISYASLPAIAKQNVLKLQTYLSTRLVTDYSIFSGKVTLSRLRGDAT
ncbi:MAG: hypothetical protein P8175_14140 [Deltaproteobacteria bacterium]|jgi:hypothetical protein